MGSIHQYQISVRELAEWALLSGSITAGFAPLSRMREGMRAHKLAQELLDAGYEREKRLSALYSRDGQSLLVAGRADAARNSGNVAEIIEFKTARRLEPDFVPPSTHVAQARIYAYILALDGGHERAEVTVSYITPDGKQLHGHTERMSFAQLKEVFEQYCGEYLDWMALREQHVAERDASLASMTFPYPELRDEQREFMDSAAEAIENSGKAYIEAPTGTGKTCAALFPSLEALGRGFGRRVFYLTAKNSGKLSAQELVGLLSQRGAVLRTMVLTAKESICPNVGSQCHPLFCERADGYYDRFRDAVKALCEGRRAHKEDIERVADAHNVCPFELSLDYSLECDLIIADYNYVFDPRVRLRRFFDFGDGDNIILVDEAHNLIDRAREMYSATLMRRKIKKLADALRDAGMSGTLIESLDKQEEFFAWARQGMSREAPYNLMSEVPAAWIQAIRIFIRCAEDVLPSLDGEARELLLEGYFDAQAFISTQERFNENTDAVYAESTRDGVSIRIFCFDPSKNIAAALEKARAAVFFSATLAPPDYVMRMLGGERGDGHLSLASPFPSENLLVLLDVGVKTTYRHRDSSYARVAEQILGAVSAREGHYLAFFPSYKYLNAVLEYMGDPPFELLVQRSAMSAGLRDEFIREFSAPRKGRTLLGMAVMGGSFAEGVDLPGDRLIGAIVVGVGLPQVCLERELIRSRLDAADENGFAYAYVYPGMTRVLQAAGRVIRSSEDMGVALLLDERYRHEDYQGLLPPHYDINIIDTPEQAREALEAFWED